MVTVRQQLHVQQQLDRQFTSGVGGWKLAKYGTGQAAIAVSISYPGASSTTVRTEQITITS